MRQGRLVATRFYIGAKNLRGDIASYAKRFDLLEVVSGSVSNAGGGGAASVPSLPTLKRWRKAVPPHFAFTVVAGPELAALRPGEALDKGRALVAAAADVLEARSILLPTPAEVTPSAVWRERLARVAEGFLRDVTNLVWEPRGVWEIEDAAVLARKLGLVLAVDAARDPVPAGPVAYARLRALGETRSFGPSALERVVEAIGGRRDAFVVLETDGALAECKLLRRLAQAPDARDRKNAARVVRPRVGAVKVRDDEQE
jgi:uncharacterized protein YecE (DUF72 family)